MKTPNTLTAQDLIEAANAAFADGDLATSRQRLARALAMDPRNAELLLAVGHFHLHAGDTGGALMHYTQAVQLSHRMPSAHSSRALALMLLGRQDEAEAAALEALTLKPHDGVALKVLTRLLLDRNRVDEAERIARLILQLSPDDPEAKQFAEQAKVRRSLLRSGHMPAALALPAGGVPADQSSLRSADHLPPSTAAI